MQYPTAKTYELQKRNFKALAPTHKRILVVEDDHEMCALVAGVIFSIDAEAEVDWASSAERARALLARRAVRKESPYDLVLVDIFLEGEASGLDFWKDLQQQLPEVPIVMTSCMPMHKFFTAVGPGVVAPPFLEKPFKPAECRRVFQALLNEDVFTG